MNDARQLVIQYAEPRGKAVVYVMSRDQRAHDNHALLAAQDLALQLKLPLYVLFVLKDVTGRSREHYAFMLDGLKETAQELAKHQIEFVLRTGNAATEIPIFLQQVDAAALFFDFSPLAHARQLVKSVAATFGGPVTVVDTHNIVPVWTASTKQEFAAHTMRPKIHKNLQKYVVEPPKLVQHPHTAHKVASISWQDAEEFIKHVPSCGITLNFEPGEMAARARLDTFIKSELDTYALSRNDFANDSQSGLSPYLHFGHISSLRVAIEVLAAVNETPLLFQRAKMAEAGNMPSRADGMNALLEEMIVRKELSDNFCLYGKDYRSLDGAPAWAQNTLDEHAKDPREFTYNQDEWEAAQTHDPAWNAAQHQLARSGKLHGYLRMYWAKKLLEWSKSPEEAIKTAIYLNDKYSIDGGDPNGYVGILWSIAGLHDRPWFERAVYGKIRYMNSSGLSRKTDVQAYIKKWTN